MVFMKRADIFCQVGMELEVGWVPKVIEKAKNPKIVRNARMNFSVLSVFRRRFRRSRGKKWRVLRKR